MFLLLLTGILSVYGQNRLVLQGNVIDGQGGEAVEFCNVTVVSLKDSVSLIAGTQTDEKGRFVLQTHEREPFLFRVSFIGYQNIEMRINPMDFLSKGKDTVYLKDLRFMPSSESLEAVEIVSKIKAYEMDADRLVVNVDESAKSTVVTAFDLLRKVPGVSIDKDDNLTLNGRSGVLFQFDGRDMRIGWEALKSMLKGMNPQQIERFEVITNPSAKYDAEGTAGIINIRMKKNQNYGVNGSANASAFYSNAFSANGGLNLNYVDDKWMTSLNYNYSDWGQKMSNSSIRRNYLGSDTMQFVMPETEMDFRWRGHNVSLSADYMADDNNLLGFYATYSNNMQPEQEYISEGNISMSPFLDRYTESVRYTQRQYSRSDNLLVGLNYLHKFDTLGTKLQFDVSATFNGSEQKQMQDNRYVLLANDSVYKRERIDNMVNNFYNSFAAKVDFHKPTRRLGTFETGMKLSVTNMDNEYSSHYNYLFTENILAGYFSYSKSLGKNTSLRAGLRVEYTDTKGELLKRDTIDRNDYCDIFPNVSLNHNFNPYNSLTLSYNYRISRPSYEQMNPFLLKQTDYVYTTGNPYLKPQYTHNVGLSYSLFYMAFLNVNYGYTRDFVCELLLPYGTEGVSIQQPGNVATSQNLNVGLSVVAPLAKWLDINLYGQINYSSVFSENSQADIDMDEVSYMFFANANLTLPLKLKLSLNGFYMSGGLWGVYRYDGAYSFNMGLSRAFLEDDRLNVSLNAHRLFSVRVIGSEMSTDEIYQRSEAKIPGAMFSVTVRYNFGKMYQGKKLKRIESDDMDQRAKGGTSGGNNRMGGGM